VTHDRGGPGRTGARPNHAAIHDRAVVDHDTCERPAPELRTDAAEMIAAGAPPPTPRRTAVDEPPLAARFSTSQNRPELVTGLNTGCHRPGAMLRVVERVSVRRHASTAVAGGGAGQPRYRRVVKQRPSVRPPPRDDVSRTGRDSECRRRRRRREFASLSTLCGRCSCPSTRKVNSGVGGPRRFVAIHESTEASESARAVMQQNAEGVAARKP